MLDSLLIFFPDCELFARYDCFAGANFSARTAFDAGIGIDVVDVAFRDSFYGTNGETSAASDAFVSNNVCHNGFG